MVNICNLRDICNNNDNIFNMKQVFLKAYGYCVILERSGNYALLLLPSGGKMCYNILGHEIINPQTKLF